MAIKKTIEIDVNSSQANTNVNQLTNSIDQNTEATKSLKQQYREAVQEAQRLAEEFGATSKQAAEAAKRAANLKDSIEDTNDAIAAFKGEGAFNATAKALGSVASGFSAVEGALVLVGNESKEFEETMIRLQGAMALAQGLEGLEDLGRSFSQLKTVAVNAFNGIRAAIGATGIGLLVIALGTIVTYWDDIKASVSGVTEEQKKLNEATDANLKAEQSKLESLGSQDNVLKLQGKSEKDILKLKVSQVDAVIKATEAQIKQNDITAKAQIEAAQRNKDILNGIIDFISRPLKIVLTAIDSIGKSFGKDFGLASGLESLKQSATSLIFDPEETAKEAEATRAESLKALDKLKNDRAGFLLSIKNLDNQASQEAKAKAKEQKDEEEKLAKEKAEALERIRQGEIDTQAERRAEELRQVREHYAKLIAEAEKFGVDTTNLKEAQRTKEKELEDKFAKEDDEAELEYWTKQADASIQRTNEEKQNADARMKISELEFQQKMAQANETAQVLGNLGQIVGEQTAAGKALGIATALINTYIGVSEALKQESTLPSPFDYVAKVVNVAGILATGFKTVKAITAVKVPGGGGGGAGVPGAAGITAGATGGAGGGAPQFNIVGGNVANQLGQVLGNQPPVQAFVVGSQVTSQQALDRNIITNASLG